MNLFAKHRPIEPGDRVIVGSWTGMEVVVERIEKDFHTGVTHLFLDWGVHGKSRVAAHDEGKVWFRHVPLEIN